MDDRFNGGDLAAKSIFETRLNFDGGVHYSAYTQNVMNVMPNGSAVCPSSLRICPTLLVLACLSRQSILFKISNRCR